MCVCMYTPLFIEAPTETPGADRYKPVQDTNIPPKPSKITPDTKRKRTESKLIRKQDNLRE